MEQTTYYKLNLPSGEDYYNIEHQNENMRALDSALFGRLGVGAYVGDGAEDRLIPLPRKAAFVLLLRADARMESDGTRYGGLALADSPANRDGVAFITIEEGGFRLKHRPDTMDGTYIKTGINSTGETYHYLWG